MRQSQINSKSKWMWYGSSVAQSTNEGNDDNVFRPYAIQIDDERTMIIVDYGRHCVWEWPFGASSGIPRAGGTGKGSRNNQLNYPTDVILDKNEQKLIICDRENRRVVRWPRRDGTNGETILSDVKCFGIAMDADRYLYVSDIEKHEVRRWRIGESAGELVAGGNLRGNRLDQLHTPHYIFIDSDRTLFISDWQNHRVVKWPRNAREGIRVAGGMGSGNGLSQLSWPEGIYVDLDGSIYVADSSNNRIMRWLTGDKEGSVIVGGNSRGNRRDQFDSPMNFVFDSRGDLYVADSYNSRVQRFETLRL